MLLSIIYLVHCPIMIFLLIIQTPTNAGICLLKLSEQYLCSGDVTGQVYILDPASFQIVGSFPAHMSGMCDMDVVDNYLITCGLTQQ